LGTKQTIGTRVPAVVLVLVVKIARG
jgi:hypothetical protein